MKLIQEYTVKVIVFMIVLTVLMEIGILILLYINSSQIFMVTYQQTVANAEIKSIEITKKLESHTSNIIMKYFTELKLIGKHALLLSGKKGKDYTKINKYSNIFNINDNQKEIIIAQKNYLINKDCLRKYFNEDRKIFDYFHKYEEDYSNIYEQNELLNELFSDKHQELNAISYYSPSKDKSSEELSIKFMISILKTIYIKRYIGKRMNMDYLRFLILHEDEIYIYPPEEYNHINLYNFQNIYPVSDCKYFSNNETHKFPLCVYNFITNKLTNGQDNFLTIIYENIFFDKVFSALCIKIPLIDQSIICIEIDFSSFYVSWNFNNPEKFEFGLISIFENDSIFLLYNSNKFPEFEFINYFNDTVPEKFIINPQKSLGTLSLFHFLYFNLIKTTKEHNEVKVNFTEIEQEYNNISNQILFEIKQYKEGINN